MIIKVSVKPNSKKNQLVSFVDNQAVIKVTAKAHDGEANKSLVKFLAQLLDLPASSVIIYKGQRSRIKFISLPDNTRLNKLYQNEPI